jgi:uncharacterized protein (TIGR03067 family)
MAKRPADRGAWAEDTVLEQVPGSVHHEDHWDEPEFPRQMLAAELQSLQGSWHSIGGRHRAEFLIAGRLFTFRLEDHAIYMGSLELDPVATPMRMDIRIEEGPSHHKGKSAACIYAVDGEYLRFCATQPGKPEILDDFPSENDPKYLLVVFRRAPRQGP